MIKIILTNDKISENVTNKGTGKKDFYKNKQNLRELAEEWKIATKERKINEWVKNKGRTTRKKGR